MSPTQLFAGVEPHGDAVCFYCFGKCPERHLASKIVKKSFTGLDSVSLSKWVCEGCIAAMGEYSDIEMADGEKRVGQKIRCYSWVVDLGGHTAYSKTHRAQLRSVCVNPPSPPFVICISDSGQKHLLYRSKVCWSREQVVVTLEGDVIDYTPEALADRIALCVRVCSVVGRPAMAAGLNAMQCMSVCETFGESVLSEWLAVCGQSLTRLAVWLCPSKEECLNELRS